MRWLRLVIPDVFAVSVVTFAPPASADHNQDQHENMDLLVNRPNATGAVNSDIAFWGDRAYVGNYDGFRIFDISDPANPALLSDFRCFGPQNDPVVWNNLLFLAIDRTLAGPDCGSPAVPSAEPTGWEGVRIFDVSNPRATRFIKGVYTDCGAHTITLFPKNPAQVMLYVSCRTRCRPARPAARSRGPEAGRDPLHGVIQVIQVPVNNPSAAKEIAEPQIMYPGDPDNQFDWAEHGLGGLAGIEPAARACHDISVFVELRVAAAACAEQGQLWRIRPNGVPDTENPIWVFDDVVDETGTTGDPADPGVVVDFFHSATFSWDGSVVNFIDESFGDGCPPTTPAPGFTGAFPGDTGRMFFVDAATGGLLSQFMLPRPEAGAYCSAHVGNTTVSQGRDLLVNAWYMGVSTSSTSRTRPIRRRSRSTTSPRPDRPARTTGRPTGTKAPGWGAAPSRSTPPTASTTRQPAEGSRCSPRWSATPTSRWSASTHRHKRGSSRADAADPCHP